MSDGTVAGNRFEFLAHQLRRSAQQPGRVRMPRTLEHFARGAFLDNAPGVRDRDAVSHLRDHAQIVRDKKQRQAEIVPQARQQFENLFLHGDIERRRGLVGDEQARRGTASLVEDPPPWRHAPPASAIAIIARCRKPPESWCGYCRARNAGSGTAARSSAASTRRLNVFAREARVVRANRFGDLRAHAHHGIERGHRLLKNHGDVAAAYADLSRVRRA